VRERFVVIGSLQRGAVDPPEPLNEDGQAAAFWGLRMDESRAMRVAFEMGDSQVIWRKPPRGAMLARARKRIG